MLYTQKANYPDMATSFLIPIAIGIFAFALPLLLQTAARIDDKYKSSILIKVFKQDWICQGFIITLFISITSCLLWALQLPRLVDWGNHLNVLIDNSSLILLFITTCVLIIFTICVVWLTYVFYLPEKAFERLKKKYKNAKNEKDRETLFRAIGYIYLYSIRTEGESLARNIYDFFDEEFHNYREINSNSVIIYPQSYYDVIFDANECLCGRKRKSISLFSFSFFSFFIDLNDLSKQCTISDKTYNYLWGIIRQYLFYERDDYVSSYWEFAHQYASNLHNVHPIYDSNWNVTNQEEIDFWGKEEERFLDFHYAIGGLLMFEQKYALLSELMSWSDTIPPRYYLVPETMSTVINRFMNVSLKEDPFHYEKRFRFPDVKGVKTNDVIQTWIKRYITVLFLRQYTLMDNYIHISRVGMPTPPTKLFEKARWITELSLLKNYVKKYLNAPEILKGLGMEYLLSEKWYKDNNKSHPIEDINLFINTIKNDIAETKKEQPVLEESKRIFIDKSKQILSDAFDESERFMQSGEGSSENKFVYRGMHCILEKEAFSDSEVSYATEDTITAETIKHEFISTVTNIFFLMNCFQYRVKEIDLFRAVESLAINKEDFVIMNVGINLSYYRDYIKISELEHNDEKWRFNDIEIINIPSNRLINSSLIIIRKEDKPYITYRDVNDDLITKYNLKPIIPEKKIYASLIDLNQNEMLLKEVGKDQNIEKEELREKVLACIDLCAVVSCKKNAKCVQLNVFSQFNDSGNPNNLEEIKNPWK